MASRGKEMLGAVTVTYSTISSLVSVLASEIKGK